jgi:pilus assembly protein Flp/PilA
MTAIGWSRCRRTPGRSRQRGVTSIEYALIGALIAVVIAGSVTQVGTTLSSLFTRVADGVSCATVGTGC